MKQHFFHLRQIKPPGFDDISNNVVLNIYAEIKDILFHIFNNSINTGIFPDNLKIAKVIPIFKSGDESLLTNYRPISVLPAFSKVLERIMYNRIYNYLTEHKFIYDKQFGFQKNTATEHAILQLAENISSSFDNGEFTIGIFIDLSKAFDTVDHNLLLQKLKYYGIKDSYHD